MQKLLTYCQKLKNTEMVISVLLSVAELYWRSSSPTIAMPVLLEALALSKEYRLQYLASETVLNLAYAQLILGIPEQALTFSTWLLSPSWPMGHPGQRPCHVLSVQVPSGFSSFL